VVDKMALMIYRELEKAPIKIVAVYMWTHMISTSVAA
jgi:hypothetical protein